MPVSYTHLWNRYFDGTLEDIPDEYRVTGSGEELEPPSTITVLVVERQPVHLAFFVADNGDRLFKGIDRLNVPANLML